MVAEHALHECPIESRGGEGAAMVGERDQAVRIDGFEQDRQPFAAAAIILGRKNAGYQSVTTTQALAASVGRRSRPWPCEGST